MPSTLVHVALAGLLAAALLGESFDGYSVAVVLVATAVIDLDAFLGLVVPGTHRAALHTLLLPALAAGVVYVDTRVRDASLLARWRPDGARVAWVAVAAVAVAGIGLDMAHNGVNAFYPLYDQFYTVDGQALVSDQRGFVQTFVEVEPPGSGDGTARGRTTSEVHYSTGVDPSPGPEDEDVERVFPLAASGRELLVVVAGYGTLAVRFWEERSTADA